MEIINDNNASAPKPTSTTPFHTIGRIVVVCVKVLLGIFLFGWTLAAVAVLVSFISLIAVGVFDPAVVAPYYGGTSLAVIAGLVCAVVVLFMGIVGDVGFTLLRGKPLNLRRLGVSAIVWLIFLVWACVSVVINIPHVEYWGEQIEQKVEQLEEKIEGQIDEVENIVEVYDGIPVSFDFHGRKDIVSFAIWADKIDLPDDIEELVFLKLTQNQDVKITTEWKSNNGFGSHKSVTISTKDGDFVINHFDD